jgi:twitching motility protein PilT
MQTFDQALLGHYQAGRVSMEDALQVASSPHDFKLLVAAEGRTSTSMSDLGEERSDEVRTERRVPEPVSPAVGNGRPSAPPPGVPA